MPKITVLMAIAALLALAGCEKHDSPYTGHDVEWFKAHPTERDAEIKWCQNNASTDENTDPACKRAESAWMKNAVAIHKDVDNSAFHFH